MPISLCSSITNEHGRELTEHGSALFPIASYDDDILTNPVPWHWHDELEAGIIIEGTAIVAAGSENTNYPLEKVSSLILVFFMPPGGLTPPPVPFILSFFTQIW